MSLIETLRSTSGGIAAQELLVGLRAAAGRVAVEHVLAQQVEGGADAARRAGRRPAAIASSGVLARRRSAGRGTRERLQRRRRRRLRLRGLVGRPAPRVEMPPAHVEVAFHRDPPRPQRLHEVVQDHVRHVLVVDAAVAVGLQVELQALELDAVPVGHVADADGPEVGLPGLRADRRELRAGVDDRVVAAGMACWGRSRGRPSPAIITGAHCSASRRPLGCGIMTARHHARRPHDLRCACGHGDCGRARALLPALRRGRAGERTLPLHADVAAGWRPPRPPVPMPPRGRAPAPSPSPPASPSATATPSSRRSAPAGWGRSTRPIDRKLGKTVALKLIRARTGRASRRRLERFRRELALAREVTHPNVCRVHDLGEIDGDALHQHGVRRGADPGRPDPVGRAPLAKQTIALGRQICAGLQAIHDREIVHRDLKPGNIMVGPLAATRWSWTSAWPTSTAASA